ncbi:MAG: hypothetical protein ACWA40_05055 [Planktomarina sp.]
MSITAREFITPPELPLQRALLVMQVLGQKAPIKLVDLEQSVPIPKTALHQICSQLVDIGWVRKRVSDKAFMLTHQIEEFFATARFTPFEIDVLQPLFQKVKKGDKYHLTLTMFQDDGTWEDVEGTRQPDTWDKDMSFTFAPAAIAAQSVLPREDQVKLTAKLIATSTTQEAAHVKAGDHTAALRKAQKQGYVLDDALPALSFGVMMPTGAAVALTVEPAATTQKAARAFLKNVDAILEEMHADVNTLLEESSAVFNAS